MKKVILSADDFGRSHDRNLAIDYAMRHALIRSTGLIVGSQFTDEAISLAIKGGYINNVHCHLNLSPGIKAGNHFFPISDQYKESKFSVDGEFCIKPYIKNYLSYSKVVFKELEGQYLFFKRATEGRANYDHIDCHLYCNLLPPVAVAYRDLIRKYHIKSARYYGEHHKKQKQIKQWLKFHVGSFLSGNEAYVVKACNVDYYITKKKLFQKDEVIELYVHPDYKNGVLIDNSVSYLGHEIVSLTKQIKALTSTEDIELVSWADFNRSINKSFK